MSNIITHVCDNGNCMDEHEVGIIFIEEISKIITNKYCGHVKCIFGDNGASCEFCFNCEYGDYTVCSIFACSCYVFAYPSFVNIGDSDSVDVIVNRVCGMVEGVMNFNGWHYLAHERC